MEDIQYNTNPKIEMVTVTIENNREWTVVKFVEKFVTNDWMPTSELVSNTPSYLLAKAFFTAYALDCLEMMPEAKYYSDRVWKSEQELWISLHKPGSPRN